MKINRIRMIEDENGVIDTLHNAATRFEINQDYTPEEKSKMETTEE